MASAEHSEKLTYTVQEFRRASGLSHSSVYKLIKEGRLQSTKVCGRRLISRQSALQLLGCTV